MKTKLPAQNIHIIGGGFSGLILAAELGRLGHHGVFCYEEDKYGGVIQAEDFCGHRLESAAFSIFATKTFEEFCANHNIELTPLLKSSRIKYFFFNTITRWPLTLIETVHFAIKYVLVKNRSEYSRCYDNHTVKSWSDKYLTKAFTTKVLSPAILGIYASPLENLDATLVFTKIFSNSKKRSLIPRGGLSQFLKDLKVKCSNYGVTFVEKHIGPNDVLSLKNDGIVIFANSFKPLKFILSERSDEILDFRNTFESERFSALLSKVKLISLRKVHLAYSESPKILRRPGLGMLLHLKNHFHSIGVLFNRHITDQWKKPTSQINPEWTETWILSNQTFSQLTEISDEEICNRVLEDRSRIFEDSTKPVAHLVVHIDDAYPVYNLDLKLWLEALTPKRGYYFIGNYMGTVGLNEIAESAVSIVSRIEGNNESA